MAMYLGNDFQYANSKGFRKKFAMQTQDRELINIGLKSDQNFLTQLQQIGDAQNEPNSDEEVKQELLPINHGLGIDEPAYLEFMNNLQSNASMGLDVAHALKMQLRNRQRALDFYGKVMAFYFLCALVAFYYGVKGMVDSSKKNQRVSMNLFAYLLPFVSFMIDASAKRVYQVSAKPVYQAIKVIITFYYLCLYVVALNRTSKSPFYWLCYGNTLGYPLLITGYWWLLIHRYLS
jgi:hypothetical protein